MDALVSLLRAAWGVFALSMLAFLTLSALSASQRPVGERAGPKVGWLHSPFYYVFTLGFDIVVGILLWFPLPGAPFAVAVTILGALLSFSGLAFALWGRLALGSMYFISTNLGAQTFAGHRLVTSGPYAIVRHPMYLGIFVAAFGSLMLYQTWTTVFLIVIALIVVRRALREEEVLAKTFGAEWLEYRRRVPMLFPRLFRKEDQGEAKG
jgi:protein-S-isoprenylcysteine O-methyltransferase Ste14